MLWVVFLTGIIMMLMNRLLKVLLFLNTVGYMDKFYVTKNQEILNYINGKVRQG